MAIEKLLEILKELAVDPKATPRIAYHLHEPIRRLMNHQGSLSDVIDLLSHDWEEE
jgi:hypothetical protein